jgi:hypothetical protein
MTVQWRFVPEQSSASIKVYEGTDGSGTGVRLGEASQPLYNHIAYVKWDGCTEYEEFANGFGWDHACSEECNCCRQGLHICAISDFVDDLQALTAVLKQDNWPKEG